MALRTLTRKLLRLRHALAERVFRLRHPEAPWLVKEAWLHLSSLLRPEMRGFEWGSGKSTLYLADHIASLVAVEHNPEWYAKVRSQLAERGKDNVDLHLITPLAETDSVDLEAWSGMSRLGHMPRKPHYYPYFNKIAEYPDASFDLLLVDGRARVACMATALSKVKPSAVVVLDNSERAHYREGFAFFDEGWRRRTYGNGLWETTIWQPRG